MARAPAKKKAPAKPRAKKETPVAPPRSKHSIVDVAAERARATPNFAPVPAAKRRRRR